MDETLLTALVMCRARSGSSMDSSQKTASPIDRAEFARGFAALMPLIRDEWPSIDAAALEATSGDLDKVIELVAARTDRTKALIRRQLAELYEESMRKVASGGPRLNDFADLLAAVKRLETLAAEEARKVSNEVLPRAEAKVKENIWISLLLSLGLGMILGLWMASGGRRGRHG